MIRIGLLGASAIAPRAVVEAARAVPGVEVVAVAARDPARAEAFARANGVPRVLPSYQALVEDDGVDLVYVGLPNALHVRWSVAARAVGKHVLCEKPLLCNASDAGALSEPGPLVAEAMHWRHHPLAARARALVAGGAIGALRSVEAAFCSPTRRDGDIRTQYALGGGALMDLGCYAISGVLSFAGPSVAAVTRARLVTGWPDVDVSADVRLSLGAVQGRVLCAMRGSIRRSLVARGDAGTLWVLGPWAPQRGHALVLRRGWRLTVERVPSEPTFVHQLRAVRAAIHGEAPVGTGVAEALAVARVIDDAYRAGGLPQRRST